MEGSSDECFGIENDYLTVHNIKDADNGKSLVIASKNIDGVGEGSRDGEELEHQKVIVLEEGVEEETNEKMDSDDYLKENFVEVKVELVEFEFEESNVQTKTFMGLDNVPVFETEIAEGEESSLEDFVELPIKTELNGNVDDSREETKEDEVLDEESSKGLGGIKVETLDEGHEDHLNMILQMAAYHKDGASGANEFSEEASGGHFLTKVSRRRKRAGFRELKCAKCSAMFRYQSTYDYHVKSQCGTKMIAESNELIKKGRNQSLTCNVCKKEMSSRTSLMVHMRIHNGERPFVCALCHRSFTQKAHLKDHMNIHLSEQQMKSKASVCPECGQVFGDKKSLVLHSKEHFGDKMFDCNVCHKRFRTLSNLSNHKVIHSNTKEFSCTVCSRMFLRKRGLVEHMRVHTKEKLYSCDICLKKFTNKGRRDTHVKRHTGELKAVCSVCDRKFACPYDLKVHERKHTGERPFSCNICGRTFNRKVIMETHMTIHTGRKDFVCTQCGEAFNRKSKLDIHLTKHTGEMFCCEICDKVFKCKAYLIPHLRTHVGEGRKRTRKRLHCILCRMEFTTQKGLQDHFVQKHPSVFKACPPSPATFVRVQSSELAHMSLQNNNCKRFEGQFFEPFIKFE